MIFPAQALDYGSDAKSSRAHADVVATLSRCFLCALFRLDLYIKHSKNILYLYSGHMTSTF